MHKILVLSRFYPNETCNIPTIDTLSYRKSYKDFKYGPKLSYLDSICLQWPKKDQIIDKNGGQKPKIAYFKAKYDFQLTKIHSLVL